MGYVGIVIINGSLIVSLMAFLIDGVWPGIFRRNAINNLSFLYFNLTIFSLNCAISCYDGPVANLCPVLADDVDHHHNNTNNYPENFHILKSPTMAKSYQ